MKTARLEEQRQLGHQEVVARQQDQLVHHEQLDTAQHRQTLALLGQPQQPGTAQHLGTRPYRSQFASSLSPPLSSSTSRNPLPPLTGPGGIFTTGQHGVTSRPPPEQQMPLLSTAATYYCHAILPMSWQKLKMKG